MYPMVLTEEAIAPVVERYAGMITRIAWNSLGSRADAEDVMQDVFVRLMAQRGFNSDEHLKAWLIRVTVNRCRDILKSGWRSRTVPLAADWPEAPRRVDETLDQVMRLKPADRSVIYLYYYEQYTVPEIAQLLGERQSTVSSRLVRARHKLRGILQEGGTPNG